MDPPCTHRVIVFFLQSPRDSSVSIQDLSAEHWTDQLRNGIKPSAIPKRRGECVGLGVTPGPKGV